MVSRDRKRLLEVAEQAARTAGAILRQRQSQAHVWLKQPKDVVTEADLEAQRAIRSILLEAFPDHGFVGEEERAGAPIAEELSSGYCWIVDPLDGTTNYVHGLQSYAASVGLAHEGKLIAGVIYDPIAEECFRAIEGGGAQLNGKSIQASRCESVDQALVAVSFAPGTTRDSPDVARFVEVLLESQSVRRLGSAALNMCYLAAGRLDAYWSSSVKIWDIAAGIVIVREAGGLVSGLGGWDFDLAHPEFAAAATRPLLSELLEILARTS